MRSKVIDRARWIYSLGAASNFVVTIPAFIAYNRYVDLFAETRPNYPFLVWIWSGMAFLWGVSFVEIARDPMRAYPLVKYSWLEKCVTSTSVLAAYAIGDVPGKFVAGVFITDVIWIPLFIYAHLGLAGERHQSERSPHDTHV